jgi:CopA family copper-resistance protein
MTSRLLAHRGRPSRRTFVKGLVAGGVVAGFGTSDRTWAQAARRPEVPVLSGTDFDLAIGEQRVNFTGAPRTAQTVNGSLPAPTLRFREGETVTLRVSNRLRDDPASVHWHGLLLPANMDGVPGLSFNGIGPGEAYEYRFEVRQAGTYWYHSHSAFQEQLGLYGALVIDPRGADPIQYDREHVVLLSDWTDERPERIFAKLKKQSDYYNFHQRTVGNFFSDVRERGWSETIADRLAWGEMRMKPTDLADVTGATYTYLMNGTTPAGNWAGQFRSGERVRLRFINGSAMTYFDVRIPGLKMTVVAADGQNVHPVTVDEFRIAVAETVDVLVEPSGQDAFTIFAQSFDRSGYARGTLAVREGLEAPVPDLDRRPLLSMADMGHDMEHGERATSPASAPAAADPHAGHTSPVAAAPSPADPHAGHAAPAPAPAQVPPQGGPDPHAGHAVTGGTMAAHPPTESGNPLVDMQTMMPAPKLDDPGIGLRDNGRRVLTYADLHSVFPDPDGRDPARTIELHLTGHMERFVWSFDGVKFSDAAPLRLLYGERVRIVLVNDTMMTHPIHLHGMWSDVEDASGAFHVRKHTVDMPPGTRRSYRVTADALGRWAYHCHLLYHMEAGMFREVRVEE